MTEPSPTAPPPEPPRRSAFERYRILLVVAMFLGAYLVVWLFDLQQYFERERIQQMMESAGLWGFLLFVAIFAVGELLHIPGVVFVGAAMLVYDRAWGTAAAFTGAVTSVTVSFLVVRAVGGQALAQIERPLVKKILARLEQRPIATVILLRLVFWMAPPVNYALAMTRLRFREYLLGSAIGLVVPVVLAALFLEWIIANML